MLMAKKISSYFDKADFEANLYLEDSKRKSGDGEK